MNGFTYQVPTQVIFGKDTQAQAGQAVRAHGGSRVLVLYGGGSAVKSGLVAQVEESLAYYQRNAKVIFDGLKGLGLTVSGGVNSPYVWCKTPDGMGSWAFFDLLLERANVVTTPGAGFGPSGEGYIRLTGFGDAQATRQAVERIRGAL